ncbi:flagellar-specific ATP synthase FliI [Deferribacter desulfuricans SSM1]|uniref:Flagellar-specific ATP synthase FliI n=1 Tax=Deferribacter desulfuricans (strain DSM 14783 / JCM 11476 / NBRC 101012 / SSM1) TaxID=639282 RepID=D3PBP6_DEFDS|nr:flagellar protein export ATPase FliI [Deferribacter desulfuricans]BAI80019.1 flagellar-specific ATP synthase FliI [Deferribacter desulfuricans SSM1]
MKKLKLLKNINFDNSVVVTGKVTKIVGLTIEADGPLLSIGTRCEIEGVGGKNILAEIVGFKDDRVILMPYAESEGIAPGSIVRNVAYGNVVKVSEELLGRVLDGLGRPIDSNRVITNYELKSVYTEPPSPLEREIIKDAIHTGVKAIDALITIGKGQRVGIFAGSGVGKSVLLGMIARNSSADVNVIALIGERGREVREFIERDLGEEGLKKSVVVVATSDQSPLVRKMGAFVATTIAEYFRSLGKDVMFMMDSVTRFAMAQREIGLTVGEPPTTKGYTPSVFALLPKLLERAGTKKGEGTITGLYTVLVEGDDLNDPIADSVRSIIDGHIVLDRNLAAKNHFPAIDVMMSASRLMKEIVDERHFEAAGRLRDLIATYREAEDLINIGAYVKGSNKKIDEAILKIDLINNFLKQKIDETSPFEETKKQLFQLAGVK